MTPMTNCATGGSSGANIGWVSTCISHFFSCLPSHPLQVGLCTPNADTHIPTFGHMLSMLFQWYNATAYLPNDKIGAAIEKLKSEYIPEWLQVRTELHTLLHCSTVHYSTLLYSTLLYFTLHYFTLLHITLLYCTLLYFTAHYFTLLYITLLYITLLYITLLYCTLLYFTLYYFTSLCFTSLHFTSLYFTLLYFP